jgi:hypothetical protein
VFCTEKGREGRALRRKLLIESRKRFLDAHKKSTRRASLQLDIPQTTVRRVVQNRLTSVPIGHGNPDNNLEFRIVT